MAKPPSTRCNEPTWLERGLTTARHRQGCLWLQQPPCASCSMIHSTSAVLPGQAGSLHAQPVPPQSVTVQTATGSMFIHGAPQEVQYCYSACGLVLNQPPPLMPCTRTDGHHERTDHAVCCHAQPTRQLAYPSKHQLFSLARQHAAH